MADAYYTPGIVEVMQALVMPDETDDDGIYPWLMRILPQHIGMTYGEMFRAVVTDSDHPVLPLGLFQMFEKPETGRGYVWTNPKSSVTMRRSDMIYVLGLRTFGKCVY